MVRIWFGKGRSGGREFLGRMEERRDGIEGEEDRLQWRQVSAERREIREELRWNCVVKKG